MHRVTVELSDVDPERRDPQLGADETRAGGELATKLNWAFGLTIETRGDGYARRAPCISTVHAFTAPAVSPATILRLKNMNMIRGGIVMRSTSMNSKFHRVLNWLWKL